MKRVQLKLLENYSPYDPSMQHSYQHYYHPNPPMRQLKKEDDVERVGRSTMKGAGAGAVLGGVGALASMVKSPSGFSRPFKSYGEGAGPFSKIIQRGREMGGVVSRHKGGLGWGIAAGAALGGAYKGAKKIHKIYGERQRKKDESPYGPSQPMTAPYPYQPSTSYDPGGYPSY